MLPRRQLQANDRHYDLNDLSNYLIGRKTKEIEKDK
jgi:hypothetical protein